MYQDDIVDEINIRDYLLGQGRPLLYFIIGLVVALVSLGYYSFLYLPSSFDLEADSGDFRAASGLGDEGVAPDGNQVVVDVFADPLFLFVDVSGAVKRPGVYKLARGARVADALKLAGGVQENFSANWVSKNVNLSLVLRDSQKIYIPFEWDSAVSSTVSLTLRPDVAYLVAPIVAAPPLSSQGSGVVAGEVPSNTSVSPGSPDVSPEVSPDGASPNTVNVNKASQSELESLHGIGKAYATRIIENRPYIDLLDLQLKTKIPMATLEKIKEDIGF